MDNSETTNTHSAEQLRSLLKRSWMPFFGRFGRLTDIQTKAIPLIASGRNVVVSAPTASGKTEAVVAPVAEQLCNTSTDGTSLVLYVVPTRALANDLLPRIKGPLLEMGLSADLRHGDKPQLPRVLPRVLITTPESCDSLMCRHHRIFQNVATIIVDEVHVLDNTYRGDQLRVLLNRLRRFNDNRNVPIHLLSATLHEPLELAARYGDNFVVVTGSGSRSIEYRAFNDVESLMNWARQENIHKILAFCNTRHAVENAAQHIATLFRPYPVVAHHGSLSAPQRRHSEAVMQQQRTATCVATSTLEIGVDIGNVDLIALLEVPWSISALMQRLGRGNRRTGAIQAAAVVQDADEAWLMNEMITAARRGAIEPVDYRPDLSVVIQQVFSILYYHKRKIPLGDIGNVVSSLATTGELECILEHLLDKGWVERHNDLWCASQKLRDVGNAGYIHSNIPDNDDCKVIDQDSGREVGTVSGLVDSTFVLARTCWRVVARKHDIIVVKRMKSGAQAPVFAPQGNKGKYFSLLPPDLRSK